MSGYDFDKAFTQIYENKSKIDSHNESILSLQRRCENLEKKVDDLPSVLNERMTTIGQALNVLRDSHQELTSIVTSIKSDTVSINQYQETVEQLSALMNFHYVASIVVKTTVVVTIVIVSMYLLISRLVSVKELLEYLL